MIQSSELSLMFLRWKVVPGKGAVHYVLETLQQRRKVCQQLRHVSLPDCFCWRPPWRYMCRSPHCSTALSTNDQFVLQLGNTLILPINQIFSFENIIFGKSGFCSPRLSLGFHHSEWCRHSEQGGHLVWRLCFTASVHLDLEIRSTLQQNIRASLRHFSFIIARIKL